MDDGAGKVYLEPAGGRFNAGVRAWSGFRVCKGDPDARWGFGRCPTGSGGPDETTGGGAKAGHEVSRVLCRSPLVRTTDG